jgi:DNA-binding SARP family transcriptional activator
MEFRLLGTVEARADGQVLDIGPRQRRLVLALLLLEPNQTVPVARFVDLMWPDDPPQGAYPLHLDPLRVDVHRFRRMVGEARNVSGSAERAESLRAALELWRGPALADVADPEVRSRLCGGLDELRCEAVEDRIAADLECGRHRALVGELFALLVQEPLRERLVGHLMLAQYRSGMRAAALDTFHTARSRLAGELGLDPGVELCRLHEAILRDDPALELSPPPARTVRTPRQLPPDVAGFTGRDEQLHLLSTLRNHLVLIVGGPASGRPRSPCTGHIALGAAFPTGSSFSTSAGMRRRLRCDRSRR